MNFTIAWELKLNFVFFYLISGNMGNTWSADFIIASGIVCPGDLLCFTVNFSGIYVNSENTWLQWHLLSRSSQWHRVFIQVSQLLLWCSMAEQWAWCLWKNDAIDSEILSDLYCNALKCFPLLCFSNFFFIKNYMDYNVYSDLDMTKIPWSLLKS